MTVEVVNGGVGGRNQQLTLALAKKIPGQNITVLSAGTDGIDGNSPATGAIADGTTLDRARTRALDVAASLASFNAHPLFEALGDAIITGYTGTAEDLPNLPRLAKPFSQADIAAALSALMDGDDKVVRLAARRDPGKGS